MVLGKYFRGVVFEVILEGNLGWGVGKRVVF